MERGEVRSLWKRPVIVAPMAGGATTVALVSAAAASGALGFLAAGYKTVEAMTAEQNAVRAATSEAFGINVFVPGAPTARPEQVVAYAASLAGDAARLRVSLGEQRWNDDNWDAKIEALLADPPAIVGFTFGCPGPAIVEAFHDAGALVAVTVTDAREARAAAATGADCLCLQGIEAGAHRGGFTNDPQASTGLSTLTLVAEVTRVTELPLIAAGGISGPEDVAAAVHAGAAAAQCGTAFLRCPESGAHPAYKDALADGRRIDTVLTRSFSGRPGRALVNQFIIDHPDAPAAYPEINNATRPLRAAAARAGDTDRMSLWAGTGFRRAGTWLAAEIIDWLSAAPGR